MREKADIVLADVLVEMVKGKMTVDERFAKTIPCAAWVLSNSASSFSISVVLLLGLSLMMN